MNLLIEVRYLINGLLQVQIHLYVVLFAQLVELVNGFKLLRKLRLLLFDVLESVNLFHVDIQTAWQLV
jgi:hypothetical protein